MLLEQVTQQCKIGKVNWKGHSSVMYILFSLDGSNRIFKEEKNIDHSKNGNHKKVRNHATNKQKAHKMLKIQSKELFIIVRLKT